MSTTGYRMWTNEKRRNLHVMQEILRLEPELIEVFMLPKREFRFTLRLRRDNGTLQNLEGWRVQHVNPYRTGEQPFKGGFMRTPTLNLHALKTKAVAMTKKCALVGPRDQDQERVPFGGSKGGLKCDPREYSENETAQQMELCAKELDPVIGPRKDSLGPDAGVGPREIGYFVTTYAERHESDGIPCGAIATGKPLEPGSRGCPGRLLATGRGMHEGYNELKQIHLAMRAMPQTPRVIIDGFGNVGSSYAILSEVSGIQVIGISDIEGGIYNPKGLDVKDVVSFKKEMGMVMGYPHAKSMTSDKLLLQSCDMLVIASTENRITEENAPLIQAPIIGEGANAPTTAEADKILRDRGIFIIPDILFNAGGVTVSYFEWCQDVQGEVWTENRVNERLKEYMIGGADRAVEQSNRFGVDLRLGADIAAISFCAPALRTKHRIKKMSCSLV